MSHVAWLVPGALLVAFVGLVGSRAIGRGLRVHPAVAMALVASAGVVLAATLTPLDGSAGGPGAGSGVCDFRRIGPPPVSDLHDFSEASLNILLFVPLGFVVGLLPRSRWKVALLVASIASPFVIETTQLLVTSLHRACESADVVDNLTGLGVGLLVGTTIGTAAAALVRALRARRVVGGHR